MADLFKEVIPAIMQTKKKVVTEENEKDYVPYVVNKALSFHSDCISYANEMNMVPGADRLLQFHYMLNTIRGYRRPYEKWQKLEKSDDLEAVKEYYNYSNEKAKAALELLTEEAMEAIKKNLYKGGIHGKSKRFNRGEAK